MPLAMGTPVLQPMTAAHPNLDVEDWLQSIPVEIRRRVLPFCDIPSLVLFAVAPTSYRRVSFERMSNLEEDYRLWKRQSEIGC
mmetsp:Transcript_27631/g.50012  ORF Transcript_27631/g.50012 Transcript_27631/m.50012 type:complete len:83 (-) Transcript_27631:3-251(-)